MRRIQVLAPAIVLWLVADAASARAQALDVPGRFDVSAGVLWMGATNLASGNARETTSTGGDFQLFTSSTTLASAISSEVRVGVRVTRSLELEAAASYGFPQLRVALGGDAENAAAVTASERLQQFTFSAGALWYLPIVRNRRRAAPFLEAQAGLLRVLHDERTLLETGRVFQVGGGLKYALHAGNGALKAIGVRVDARAMLRSRAIFDRDRVSPAAGLGIYARF